MEELLEQQSTGKWCVKKVLFAETEPMVNGSGVPRMLHNQSEK